jgi:type VI secretion system protein ImpH
MAAESGRTNPGLIGQLHREPHRFNFFQAVRLLERLLCRGEGGFQPVGHDAPPEREVVRFRAAPSLSFPASAVCQLRAPPAGPVDGAAPPEMAVAFLGLTGPNGVLPYHYTRLLLERIRLRDYSLRDYLDLFNHRFTSFFYRAWVKYRLPFAYERNRPGSRAPA